MKVQYIVINNFGSFHGCHQIPMKDLGLVFVSGQNLDEPKSPSNGAGKSTIFDALDWCLFGEVPRGDVAKSIVNDEAKGCWVLARLEDGDSEYIVWRFRQYQGKNGVKFYEQTSPTVLWENKTALDTDATQVSINAALGLDRTIFRAAVYRAQGDEFTFAEATDGDRKDLLTAIIPELQEIDELKETAKVKLQIVQNDIAKTQGSLQQLESELAGLLATDWASAQAQWEESNAKEIQKAKENLATAENAVALLQSQVLPLPGLRTQLQQLSATVPPTQHAWQQEYDRRVAARADFMSKGIALKERMNANRLWTEQVRAGSIGEGACLRCHQPVTGQHLQEEMARAATEHQAYVVQSKAMLADLETIQAGVKEAEGYRNQESIANQAAIAQRSQQLGSLQAQIKLLEQVQKQIPQAEQNKQAWSLHLGSLQAAVWPGAAQKFQALGRQTALQYQIAFDHTVIKNAGYRAKVLQFWTDALTAKGLKNYVMDARIEDMTMAANTWVHALTGGTTWVRFETQAMTAKGTLSEKLNVRIFRHNPDGTITERNFKSWSGGEKTRVALGVDQGLSTLIADRATKPWQLYIVDESFRQHMDSGGREAIFDLLQKLDRGTVFVVDHDHEMAAQFENQLQVRVQNRRSKAWLKGVQCLAQSEEPQYYLPKE